MKVVRFLGGLGNQMFQYAFYKALKKRFHAVKADVSAYHNYPLHNGLELETIFDIKLNKINPFILKLYDKSNSLWYIRKLRRLFNLKNVYFEEKFPFEFDPTIFVDKRNRLYWGYWQNELYFNEVIAEIKTNFIFKTELDKQNEEMANLIKSSNSISIHIRRGDYLTDPLLGGLCSIDYYIQAISLITTRIPDPKFFIFSNDIDWCRTALNLEHAVFISWNTGSQSYVDMQLMSLCKHNIIANSSFSWWAAWLNNNPLKIIIAPEIWTNNPSDLQKNITPESWIKI